MSPDVRIPRNHTNISCTGVLTNKKGSKITMNGKSIFFPGNPNPLRRRPITDAQERLILLASQPATFLAPDDHGNSRHDEYEAQAANSNENLRQTLGI